MEIMAMVTYFVREISLEQAANWASGFFNRGPMVRKTLIRSNRYPAATQK